MKIKMDGIITSGECKKKREQELKQTWIEKRMNWQFVR